MDVAGNSSAVGSISEHPSPGDSANPAAHRVWHTVTACARCRTRKTKCDPTLPRCKGCERVNAPCRYWDAARSRFISRSYIVDLQERIRAVEAQLNALNLGDGDDDNGDDEEGQEALMRDPAAVRVREGDETKYLGPSSGIAMTRLVMRLAKRMTDSRSIRSVISDANAQQVKERFAREVDKPTSKTYPLVSSLPASDLPSLEVTRALVDLFNVKVQTMYPILHEPTLMQDVQDVYANTANASQNFIVRMVIAIGMQKMSIQWAGLGDSYYLDALQYFEAAVQPMNIATLQCFCLVAIYSTLTPTRTAVYYIIGFAVRLILELGWDSQASIEGPGPDGVQPTIFEVEMRKRLFWAVITMDYGFAHSLGRPAMVATGQDHLDVSFFQCVEDKYLTPEGWLPGLLPFSSRKWIAVHFYQMRLLTLEIRRKLYQKKRVEPKNDDDPWFHDMQQRLEAWRDASPEQDHGSGFGKKWFQGRYNVMIIFMYRPSPQIAKPSLRAAELCYEACEHNIYMHLEQIQTQSVELTWIFTQSLFSYVNAMLWSLAYAEIRAAHPQSDVQKHLETALHCIQLASERWPGVESALQLYDILISACMQSYQHEGDVAVSASSPASSAFSGEGNTGPRRSITSSPPNGHLSLPPPPLGEFRGFQNARDSTNSSSLRQQPPNQNAFQSRHHSLSQHPSPSSTASQPSTSSPARSQRGQSLPSVGFSSPGMSVSAVLPHTTVPSSQQSPLPATIVPTSTQAQFLRHDQQDPSQAIPAVSFVPGSQFNALPNNFNDLFNWNPLTNMSQATTAIPEVFSLFSPYSSDTNPQSHVANSNFTALQNSQQQFRSGRAASVTQYEEELIAPQYWDGMNVDYAAAAGHGLTEQEQVELLRALERDGAGNIESLIRQSNAVFNAAMPAPT